MAEIINCPNCVASGREICFCGPVPVIVHPQELWWAPRNDPAHPMIPIGPDAPHIGANA